MSEEFTQEEVDVAIEAVCQENRELLDTIKELRSALKTIIHTGDKVSMIKTARKALDKTKDTR